MVSKVNIWNAPSKTKVYDIDMKKLYQDLDVRDYIGFGEYKINGLDLSGSGLNVTVKKGLARGNNCFVQFLNNGLGLTISTYCSLDSNTLISVPPNSSGYIILEYNLGTTNPAEKFFQPIITAKFSSSPATSFPVGSICAELRLAKVVSNSTTASLSYDSTCLKYISEQFNNSASIISAFDVKTSDGYPDNGVVIVRSKSVMGESGLLLGDSGNIFSVPHPFQNPDQNYSGYISCYKITSSLVPSVYPEEGLLITKIGPSNGNAALLLGNSGEIYNLEVIVADLPPSSVDLGIGDLSSKGVSESTGSPANGLKFYEAGGVAGAASIILGVDGNLYY